MIIAICMNPVFQRTLTYSKIKLGEVNRAQKVEEMGSGKGVNVARVAGLLGYGARVILPLGGAKGKTVKKFLKHEGLTRTVVDVKAPTRVCTTVIETGSSTQTELVEEGSALDEAEIEAIAAAYQKCLEKNAEIVVISGTAPLGAPEDLYKRFTAMANKYSIPVILDAKHKVLLNTLDERPWMIKPNVSEFRETFGLKLPGTAELRRTMERLVSDSDRWAVATMGKDGLVAFHGKKGYGARVPKIKSVDAIGSGDAVSAGFAIGKIENYDDGKMIKFACACGIANALVPGPGRLKPEDVARFEERVEVFAF